MLLVVETHPVQYHAPVYRFLQQKLEVPVTVIYGSDFSVAGYRDREFGATFSWDTDLLSGYTTFFLSKVGSGAASCVEKVSAKGLGRLLRRLAPKAILTLGYRPRFYREALWEAMRTKRPVLFRAETTDHAVARGFVRSWIRDTILRQVYGRCHRLLYVGKRSKAHYLRLGVSEKKLIFSPYCVDGVTFASDEASRASLRTLTRESLGIDEDQKVVLFSGKLSLRKGPDLLVKALKSLGAEIREKMTLLFMGDGELRRTLEALCEKLPKIKSIFTGFKNQHELSAYYHAADVLILPSRRGETWGLVVNDALSHGVPCVVSDQVGCAPDLIEPGKTGEIFESESAEDLVRALTRCLALSGTFEIRRECREKVSGYSIENAAGGIAEAYRSLERE